VLFIDDQQAELAEAHAALEQPMRADHDIDLAGFEAGQHLVDLLGAAKSRQRFDLHRPIGKAIGKGLEMLLSEQRRGY